MPPLDLQEGVQLCSLILAQGNLRCWASDPKNSKVVKAVVQDTKAAGICGGSSRTVIQPPFRIRMNTERGLAVREIRKEFVTPTTVLSGAGRYQVEKEQDRIPTC